MKFLKYNNMPIHLRWELYPVAHEGKKAHYGGSFYEEVEWWKHPREVDRVSEMKHMIPEMVFLTAVRENNKSLWYRSFPFHFGMYSMIGFLGLLCLGAVMQMVGLEVTAGDGLGGAVYYVTAAAGFFGMVLGVLGALGLFHRRLFDDNLKDFTRPQDIFNLLFLMSAFVLLLLSGIANPSFDGLRGYVYSVITFNLSYMPNNPVVAAAVVLSSLVVAYIPLTHMSHFVVKYFTYHKIRWDDEPNLRGGAYEKKIGEVLQYPVTWGANHINPKGEKKTWADVATEEIEEGV
ncbi:MAG: respiratory nitrate reductase subunit gamma [bacterium]